VRAAAALVAGRPGFLKASADDAFVPGSVIISEGTRYVPYERTYRGLPPDREAVHDTHTRPG
jgi:zinc metalloprotease ZmpA